MGDHMSVVNKHTGKGTKWIDDMVDNPHITQQESENLTEVVNMLPKKASFLFEPMEKTASEEAKKEFGQAAKVYNYLKKNYPKSTLGWVDDVKWERKHVSLSDIQMDRRPGGAREQEKLKNIESAFRSNEKMEPVVLVKLPNGKVKIADGYHRTLGCKRAEKENIDAWIGTVSEDKGPWDKEMHEKKLNTGSPAPKQETEKVAFVGAIGKMGLNMIKGTGKEIKNFSKGVTGSGVKNSKTNLATLKADPTSTKMDIRGAKKEVFGEQLNRAKTFGIAGLGVAGLGVNQIAKETKKANELIPPVAPIPPNQFQTFK